MLRADEIRKAKIDGALTYYIVLMIALFILMPGFRQVIIDTVASLVMTVLRKLDELAVDYQLMRGNFHDANTNRDARADNLGTAPSPDDVDS